jgi:hypothetical protein
MELLVLQYLQLIQGHVQSSLMCEKYLLSDQTVIQMKKHQKLIQPTQQQRLRELRSTAL